MPKTYADAPSLASLLEGSSAGELIPVLARHGLQQLIELEVAAFLDADRHERTDVSQRIPTLHPHHSDGDLGLQIPRLRAGSFIPSILEPRRSVNQALYGVIMKACIGGVSTRKVGALVPALGYQSDISKSQMSRISQKIDAHVQEFLNRPLGGGSGYAHIYLYARYLKGLPLSTT